MREDAKQGTHIQGAVEISVSSEHEIMEHMNRGSIYRTTEATNCNEVSSRSHAVLQVGHSYIHSHINSHINSHSHALAMP